MRRLGSQLGSSREETLRTSFTRIITGSSCILFGAAAWWLGPHSMSNFAAQAQTTKAAPTAQVQPVSASIPIAVSKPLAELEVNASAPGTEIYTAKRGEAIPTVARR